MKPINIIGDIIAAIIICGLPIWASFAHYFLTGAPLDFGGGM